MPTAWEKRAYNNQMKRLAKLYDKHRNNRWKGLTDANDICLSCVKKVIAKNPYTSLNSWKNETKKEYLRDVSRNQIYTKSGKKKYKWVPTFKPFKRWKSKIIAVKDNNRKYRQQHM